MVISRSAEDCAPQLSLSKVKKTRQPRLPYVNIANETVAICLPMMFDSTCMSHVGTGTVVTGSTDGRCIVCCVLWGRARDMLPPRRVTAVVVRVRVADIYRLKC